MSSKVYQEVRRVEAGTVLAESTGVPGDVDMTIEVSQPRDEPLQFDVTIKNLARSTWRGISEGDPARISLGWAETVAPPVCLGLIERAYTEPDGADLDFRLSGRDSSAYRLESALSKTWNQQTADAIAADLAREVGLAPRRVDTAGAPFEGYWAVHRDRPVRYWMDQLTREAEARTGVQWEWYAHSGVFDFIRRDTTITQATVLSDESPQNLIEVSPASGGTGRTAGDEYEFEAIMSPELRRGAIVDVRTGDVSGQYQVVEYSHESSTVDGDHTTSGTLVSVDAAFESYRPRMQAESPGTLGTGLVE